MEEEEEVEKRDLFVPRRIGLEKGESRKTRESVAKYCMRS